MLQWSGVCTRVVSVSEPEKNRDLPRESFEHACLDLQKYMAGTRPDPSYIHVRNRRGKEVPFLSPVEAAHMMDVRSLVLSLLRLQWAVGAAVVGIVLANSCVSHGQKLAHDVRLSSALDLFIAMGIVLYAKIAGFHRFWIGLHELWLGDRVDTAMLPSDQNLVHMVPEEVWLDLGCWLYAGTLIAIASVGCACHGYLTCIGVRIEQASLNSRFDNDYGSQLSTCAWPSAASTQCSSHF